MIAGRLGVPRHPAVTHLEFLWSRANLTVSQRGRCDRNPSLTEMSSFVVHALPILQAKAHACVRGSEESRIDFLANLFVVCTYLQEAESSAEMRSVILFDSPESVEGWDDVPDTVQRIAAGHAGPPYAALMALLLSLEQHFPWDFPEGETIHVLTVPVFIPTVEHGDVRGTVHCWIRPPSGLRTLVVKREEVDGGPTHYHYRPIDHLRCLGMIWDRGLIPRLQPVLWPGEPAPALMDDSGQRLERRGCFRVALCPLAGPFWPRFALLPDARRFAIHADAPMHAPELLGAHLDELLTQARDHEIDILVLPELTIDTQALTRLQQGLGKETFPQAVVAGSFHVVHGDTLRNRAPVLGQDGRELWSHDKRGHFKVTGRQIRALGRASESGEPGLFCDTLPADHGANEECLEGIGHGDTLQVFDAPIGRVAVLICADALDPPAKYRGLVEEASIDLLLIIGMSAKTADFLRWAEDLRRLRTAVLFVNAGCLLQRLDPNDPEVVAFMSLPWRQKEHPVRVRWRFGGSSVEVMDDKEQWKPVTPDADALSLLPEGNGLVVNLGAWWRETFPSGTMYSGRKV
jgi:predicted amidohydrolase